MTTDDEIKELLVSCMDRYNKFLEDFQRLRIVLLDPSSHQHESYGRLRSQYETMSAVLQAITMKSELKLPGTPLDDDVDQYFTRRCTEIMARYARTLND